MGSVRAGADRGEIRIRRYQPGDYEQVVRIFSDGIGGLAPAGVREIISNRLPVRLLTCAAPLGAVLLTSRRGWFTKAFATLGAAAAVPLVLLGFVNRALARYIEQSLNEDLSNIEQFYSATGSGHGSGFWVAELVEEEASSVADASLSDRAPSAQLPPEIRSGDMRQPDAMSPVVASADAAQTAPAMTEEATSEDDAPAPLGQAREDGSEQQAVSAQESSEMYALVEHALAEDVSAEDSTDAVDQHVRKLVSGIVAAAVARFEGIATPSKPESPSKISSATPAAASKLAGPRALETQSCVSVIEAASNPSTPAPAPGTPVHPKEARSQWSYTTSNAPTTRSSASALSRQGSETALAGRGDERLGRPAAASERLPARQRRATIVGHVALERKSWRVAELRRMSVAPVYRGRGIGSMLLETLVQHARDNQFRELVLYTSSLQQPARRLYEKAGWELVEEQPLPKAGISAYTFKLDLTKKR